MKFPYAAKGVKNIFNAEILTLISTILGGIVTILAIVTLADANETTVVVSGIIMLVMSIATVVMLVVGGIINIVGYIQAARDEDGFKKAIYCTIFSIIFAFVAAFFINSTGFLGWLGTVINLISQVLQLLVFIFSVSGLMNLSAKCNRSDMIQKGANILKLISGIYIAVLIVIVLTRVFRENAFNTSLATIFSVITIILSVVLYFLYLSYLSKAKKMLGEN